MLSKHDIPVNCGSLRILCSNMLDTHDCAMIPQHAQSSVSHDGAFDEHSNMLDTHGCAMIPQHAQLSVSHDGAFDQHINRVVNLVVNF